jgi:hypothetical protein
MIMIILISCVDSKENKMQNFIVKAIIDRKLIDKLIENYFALLLNHNCTQNVTNNHYLHATSHKILVHIYAKRNDSQFRDENCRGWQ